MLLIKCVASIILAACTIATIERFIAWGNREREGSFWSFIFTLSFTILEFITSIVFWT